MKYFIALSVAAGLLAAPAAASVTLFTDTAAFQAALPGSYTLANLDAGTLGAIAVPYSVQSPAAAAAFGALGMSFTGFNAPVLGGQAGQISTPGRDRLILFGQTTGGQLTINFSSPINGIGWRSNNGDGGRALAYSGLNQGGTLIGTAFVGSGAFGGLVSSTPFRSVTLTCDFNQDLACGAYDIQFGRIGPGGVPEPASWAMMLAGFGLVGAALRQRQPAQA